MAEEPTGKLVRYMDYDPKKPIGDQVIIEYWYDPSKPAAEQREKALAEYYGQSSRD